MRAYIALGSNLHQPIEQIKQAIKHINSHPDLKILKISSLYISKALTLPATSAQADYINAVLSLETHLTAQSLLKELQGIENKQGRVRGKKWSARTLDLDILLYGDSIIDTPPLVIPHQEMCVRNFVLYPLFEIAPFIEIPEQGKLSDLLSKVNQQGLKQLAIKNNISHCPLH